MTYKELQAECAKYGLINTPMTEEQFKDCKAKNLTIDDCYSICCDINAKVNNQLRVRLWQSHDRVLRLITNPNPHEKE